MTRLNRAEVAAALVEFDEVSGRADQREWNRAMRALDTDDDRRRALSHNLAEAFRSSAATDAYGFKTTTLDGRIEATPHNRGQRAWGHDNFLIQSSDAGIRDALELPAEVDIYHDGTVATPDLALTAIAIHCVEELRNEQRIREVLSIEL